MWKGTCKGVGRIHYSAKNNPQLREEPTRVRYVNVNEAGEELGPAQYVFLERKT
jgi:hypothetical protein